MNITEMFLEGFPADTKICRKIPLEFFYKNDRMTSEQKRLFLLYTDKVNTLATLKAPRNNPSESQIYCPEIQILEVHVKTKFIGWQEMNNYVRSILHPIPYPTLLLINYKNSCSCFSAGKLRKSKTDPCRNVIEDIITAYWVDNSDCSFVRRFAWKYLKTDDLEMTYNAFYALIEDFIDSKRQQRLFGDTVDSEPDDRIQKLIQEYENDEFHIRQMLRGY